jgi:hypothetical protein
MPKIAPFDPTFNQRIASAPIRQFTAILDSTATRWDVIWKPCPSIHPAKIEMGLTKKQAQSLATKLNKALLNE